MNTSYADASNTFSDEKEESLETPVLNVFEQDNSTDDMFIVTDMLLAGPESTGKTDILSIDLLEDGTYGKPENLGSKINTEEREVFPYVDDSSMLYFASDIESKGDELNVFAAKVMDNEVSTPIKLDVQANASKDDYAKFLPMQVSIELHNELAFAPNSYDPKVVHLHLKVPLSYF